MAAAAARRTAATAAAAASSSTGTAVAPDSVLRLAILAVEDARVAPPGLAPCGLHAAAVGPLALALAAITASLSVFGSIKRGT